MKRYLFLSFLALAFLFSCSPYPRESERMAAALEQAETVYGDGNLLMETDTVLFIPGLSEASTYYARKKQFDKAALAALYNGYAEKDYDKEVAMNSFKEAERYGEIVHDSLTVARAEYQIGRLLFDDYRNEDALLVLNMSEGHLGNSISELAMTINLEACIYLSNKEFEKVDSCFQLGLLYAEQGKTDMVKNKILNNYAVYYLLQGKYEEAIACLKLIKPLDSKQTILNHLNLGEAFMALGTLDSTDYYFQLVETNILTSDITDATKAAAYHSFSKLAESNGNYLKALDLFKKYEKFYTKESEWKEKKTIYLAQQKYDYKTILNTMNEKALRHQRIISWLCVASSIVVITLGLFMVRLAKIRKQETDLKANLIHFKEENHEISGQMESFKTELERSKKKLTDVMSKEQRIIQKLAVYLENPTDKSLLQSLKHTAWGGKGFWSTATDMFDNQYPGTRQKLLKLFPDLSEQELKTLILLGLDASREDTALLLHTSIHMVDKLRNSVKKKIADYKV